MIPSIATGLMEKRVPTLWRNDRIKANITYFYTALT